MSSDIDIVLINTSHPGNIGAAARAMKIMGFKQLVLVAPKYFPHAEAEALAASAVDVLQQARVVSSLDEALMDVTTVIGTSARQRDLAAPLLTARECGTWLMQNRVGRTAVLFGEERTGLTNEALDRCHAYVRINTADEYSSLNLAQAVQIIVYELHLALSMSNPDIPQAHALLADDSAMEGYFQHLERVMVATEFLDPKFPKRLLSRLRRLYHRARPEVQELNILRGILTAVEKKIGSE
ncbi:MAG: methyltransferase [Gammaproteobacteria bacterium]|jgi:tRNA (cytidine32/uridine32-2'-O)-methyltransferase|nr:methyltransferase [Gammaproteobacteria bacterium]